MQKTVLFAKKDLTEPIQLIILYVVTKNNIMTNTNKLDLRSHTKEDLEIAAYIDAVLGEQYEASEDLSEEVKADYHKHNNTDLVF